MRRSIAQYVAAPWCALAILFAACTGDGAVTEDERHVENPAPKPDTPDNPKEETGRKFNSITGVVYVSESKPTTKQDVLNNLQFTTDYTVYYSDNSSENQAGDNIKYADRESDENIKGSKIEVTFEPNEDSFPEKKKEIKLTVFYNDKPFYLNIENGNFVPLTVTDVLNKITSGEISENNITLTAQTIDAVIDIFPVLKTVAENTEDIDNLNVEQTQKTVSDKATAVGANDIENVYKALVAQNKGNITLTKTARTFTGISGKSGNELTVYGSGYNISAKEDVNVFLEGEFKYFSNHIESLSDNIDISKVIISSQQNTDTQKFDAILLIPAKDLTEEIYNKLDLKNKDNNNLPKLNFELTKDYRSIENSILVFEFGFRHFLDIYNKYNAAGKVDEKLPKLNKEIPFTEINGITLVEDKYIDSYTLFENDGNTVKDIKNSSIKSFTVKELVDFTER